ncbi:unnamed protein product [Tetraodon nigroviridis]|uniref:(spotted green pufferfish) hypothetical protein n=1 Tax=Tetraodon nigroviridis TaxID=99883 RepID=Q4T1K4_TETNG|nr:unnamed protein product [Tetraodon nigroviridis]
MGGTTTSLGLLLLLTQRLLGPTDADQDLLSEAPQTGGSRSASEPNVTRDGANATQVDAAGPFCDCLVDTELGLIAIGSAGGLIFCLLVSTVVLACQVYHIQRRVYVPRSSRSNLDLVSGRCYWEAGPPEAQGLVGPCDASVMLEERSTPEVVGGSTVGPAEVSVGPGTLATAEAPTETGPTPPGTDATTSSIRNASSIPTSPPPGATAAGSATAPPTGPTNPADQTTTARGVFSKPPKKKAAPGKKAKSNSGTVVGWLIGSTLVLMMLSFLVIYFKKRKLNQQQISTKNWAGPSPFIESGQDDGPDGARSSHRVSLSSFLPQRMSRRLSLLQEAEEEMEDISPGTTFGDRHQEAEGRKGEDEAEETAVPAATPTSARPTEPLSPNGAVEPTQG